MSNSLITSCLAQAVEGFESAFEEYAQRDSVDQGQERLKLLHGLFWNACPEKLPLVQSVKSAFAGNVNDFAQAVRHKLKKEEPHDHNCGEGGCGGGHRHINDDLRDYQLCLYGYALAAFLEASLGGADAQDAYDDIEDFSVEYQMLFTSCCNNVQDYAASTSKADNPELAGAKTSRQAIATFTVVPDNVTKPFLDALELSF